MVIHVAPGQSLKKIIDSLPSSVPTHIVIDQDTIESESFIIPSHVTVEFQNHAKIETPEVDINGENPPMSVQSDYVHIVFEGRLIDTPHQIFDGDGLFWFLENSVSSVRANWWGMAPGTGPDSEVMAKNVKALQQACDSIVYAQKSGNRAESFDFLRGDSETYPGNEEKRVATSVVRINSGKYYIDQPIVVCRHGGRYANAQEVPHAEHLVLTDGNQPLSAGTPSFEYNPHWTGKCCLSPAASYTIIKIEGAEPIKHGLQYGNATIIQYEAKEAAPS